MSTKYYRLFLNVLAVNNFLDFETEKRQISSWNGLNKGKKLASRFEIVLIIPIPSSEWRDTTNCGWNAFHLIWATRCQMQFSELWNFHTESPLSLSGLYRQHTSKKHRVWESLWGGGVILLKNNRHIVVIWMCNAFLSIVLNIRVILFGTG